MKAILPLLILNLVLRPAFASMSSLSPDHANNSVEPKEIPATATAKYAGELKQQEMAKKFCDELAAELICPIDPARVKATIIEKFEKFKDRVATYDSNSDRFTMTGETFSNLLKTSIVNKYFKANPEALEKNVNLNQILDSFSILASTVAKNSMRYNSEHLDGEAHSAPVPKLESMTTVDGASVSAKTFSSMDAKLTTIYTGRTTVAGANCAPEPTPSPTATPIASATPTPTATPTSTPANVETNPSELNMPATNSPKTVEEPENLVLTQTRSDGTSPQYSTTTAQPQTAATTPEPKAEDRTPASDTSTQNIAIGDRSGSNSRSTPVATGGSSSIKRSSEFEDNNFANEETVRLAEQDAETAAQSPDVVREFTESASSSMAAMSGTDSSDDLQLPMTFIPLQSVMKNTSSAGSATSRSPAGLRSASSQDAPLTLDSQIFISDEFMPFDPADVS